MSLSVMQCASLLLAAVLGAEEPASPPLKSVPDPIPVKKARHYVVRVKLVEIDEQGRETVLGEPKLQTTGGTAGIALDHPDGRRFEFSVKLTDRLAPPGSGDELIPVRTTASTQVEGVLKKLDLKFDFNIEQQPRREVLREISKRSGISIAIDPESVRGLVTEMEAPVDLKVTNEPISAVLDRLIEPLNLGYVVKHDVVLIAAMEKLLPAPGDFVVKTYNVADLVQADATEGGTPDFGPLIERIKATVMPSSWERKEAAATIRAFDSTLSIVVRQTAPGHAAIERLLEKVRRDVPMKIPE